MDEPVVGHYVVLSLVPERNYLGEVDLLVLEDVDVAGPHYFEGQGFAVVVVFDRSVGEYSDRPRSRLHRVLLVVGHIKESLNEPECYRKDSPKPIERSDAKLNNSEHGHHKSNHYAWAAVLLVVLFWFG